MRLLFALICTAIAYLCLYPWTFDPNRDIPLHWEPTIRYADWLDVLANVLLFVPFGTAGMLAFARRRSLAAPLLCASGALFSYAIESAQRFIPGRSASLRDVFCNSLGAVLGVIAGLVLPRLHLWNRLTSRRPIRHAPLAFILTTLWVIANAYPFLPVLRRPQLRLSIQTLTHPTFGWMAMADIFFSVLILYAIFRCAFADWRDPAQRALLVTAALTAVFLAQTVLREFSLTPARLIASAAALATAHLLFRSRLPHFRVLALCLLLWIATRQLWPFHFVAVPSPFSWLPFVGAFEGSQTSFLRILAGKCLLYAGLIWTATQAGVRWWTITPTAMLLIGVSEWMQRWLPGRTPEATEIVLVLLAAFAVPRSRT